MERPNLEDIFSGLLAQASNPRQKASLQRIKEACDFLEQSKAAITPTSVGNYCDRQWKGPKSQSIRNSTEFLFAYVKARQGAQTLSRAPVRKNYEPSIVDENLRAYVNLLKAERDEAVRLKNRILSGLRKIPGVPVDDLIAGGLRQIEAPRPTGANTPISHAAIKALSILFDSAKLNEVGLELHRDRLRSKVTHDVLLEKQDVSAIRALIESFEQPRLNAPTS
jgi:hypothetical protein